MHAANRNRRCLAKLLATALCLGLGSGAVRAATTWFFDASQTTNLVAANATTDTISSEGYWFTQVDVGLIEMSWPATAVDYTLEFATNLSAPVWDPVTNRVTIHGDRFTAQLATGDIQRLYRLRYP